MERIKLRQGKIFYYVGLTILIILVIALIVSLIAFREFLSHRILPFTLLFLFTIGAMYFDFLERKIKRKRYDKMLNKVESFDAENLSLMIKDLLKRSGYKIKKSKDKSYKFKILKGKKRYCFSIGKNKPNLVFNKKGYELIYFYMGINNNSFKTDNNVIVMDFNDLKLMADRVI